MRSSLLALGLIATLVHTSHAIVFTINATVTSDASGAYVVDQVVNISYQVNPGYTLPASGTVSSSTTYYKTTTTSEVPIWSGVTGTALDGTWVLPDDTATAPYDFIRTFNNSTSDRLELYAGNLSGEGIGLSVNGHLVHHLFFDATFDGLDFVPQASLGEPNAYFMDYLGTYPIVTENYARMFFNADYTYFDINSLTIALSAVPEAATSLPVGLLTLLGVVVARRGRRH